MNLVCSYCQTPFTLSMSEKVAALRKMEAENLRHYDAICPRGHVNAISRERLEMFTPGWQEAIKAAPAGSMPGGSTMPKPAGSMQSGSMMPSSMPKPAAPAPMAMKPAKKAAPKKAAKKKSAAKKKAPARKAAKKAGKKRTAKKKTGAKKSKRK